MFDKWVFCFKKKQMDQKKIEKSWGKKEKKIEKVNCCYLFEMFNNNQVKQTSQRPTPN